jgi:CBS domain-containing protein
MMTMQRSLTTLTVADVMSRPVEVIPRGLTLRAAAQRLRQADVSGAPVVDEEGRCVGVLSAADFLRCTARSSTPPADTAHLIRTCCYQQPGHKADGGEGTLCTLSEGKCCLQAPGETSEGEQGLFCLLPNCFLVDWQQAAEEVPAHRVERCMTTDVVTVPPTAALTEVARMMMDAHIHRVIVVDETHRPVGIVTSTDLLAAVAGLARR